MSSNDGFTESLQSEFKAHPIKDNSTQIASQDHEDVSEIAKSIFLKIRTVWQSKILLFAFAVVGILLGLLVSWYYVPSSTGTIVLRPVSASEITKFAPLNAIKYLGSVADTDEAETTEVEGFINQQGLLNLFVFEFQTQPFMKDALAKHFSGGADDTVLSDERLLRLVSGHTLEVPTKRVPDHIFKFRTNQLERSKQAIKDALSQTNEMVKTELLSSIDSLIVAIEFGIENQKTTTLRRIKHQRDLYKLNTQNRLAFLQEQAKVARDLGVADNRQDPVVAAEASGGGTETSRVTILNGGSPQFYLRGYKAIENEIAMLRQRDQSEIDLFIGTLPNLKLKLEALEKDDRVERIKKAIALSNLKSDTFRAVVYDVDTATISKGVPKNIFLFLAVFLSLFAGVVFILLRPSYRAAKAG